MEKLPKDWKIKYLKDVLSILDNQRSPLNSEERALMKGDVPYYGANGVVDYISDFIFDEDLILIAEDGGFFEEFNKRPIAYRVYGKSWVNNHAHVLRAKEGYNQDFIFFCLEHKNIIKYLNGGTRSKLNKKELELLRLQIPPVLEQERIAELLNVNSSLILFNKQLVDKLTNKRDQIFYRFFSSTNYQSTLTKSIHDTEKQISQLVDKVKRRLIPDDDVFYQEIGIRSHAKGIFHKEPVLGKSLGNKSVFWVEPDCFVVNIVFAWEQAVAKTTEAEVGMIASHRFPMFKPKEGVLDLDYLLYFFKSAKGKNLLELASPGGAGRNKTLGQSEFLKLKIPVPPIEEQMKIVRLLNAADKEIELQKQKIEAIKLQKKGLMQQLLTGKKRLKVNNN